MSHTSFKTITSAMWNAMNAAHHITLLAHTFPDADSLASCTALGLALMARGKSIEIIYPRSIPEPVTFHIPHLQEEMHTQQPDLLISCDAASNERIYRPDAFKNIPTLVIDHHLNNTVDGTYKLVDTNASSTCELIYYLLKADNCSITKEMAHMLLIGILADTAYLRTSSTHAQTLALVSELLAITEEPLAGIAQDMIVHQDIAVLQLWGALLSQAQMLAHKKVIWMVCSQQMFAQYHTNAAALTGFINTVAQTMRTEVIILFTETADGKSKASFRSKEYDVRAIAQQFNGGGHRLAAGITSDLPLSTLIEEVLSRLS